LDNVIVTGNSNGPSSGQPDIYIAKYSGFDRSNLVGTTVRNAFGTLTDSRNPAASRRASDTSWWQVPNPINGVGADTHFFTIKYNASSPLFLACWER
jgi:hypothetical protein